MPNDKTFRLPDYYEMKDRLENFNTEEELKQNFYPLLLKRAGCTSTPREIVGLIISAIDTYTENVPAVVGRYLMYPLIPFIAKAIIVDEAVANEAVDYFESLVNRASAE